MTGEPTDKPFLSACRGHFTCPAPIWLMRQAGRFLPEYRKVRENADFLTICKTPELAAEVTLQPVRRLHVDAAIIFCDILIPLETLGIRLQFDDAPVLTPAIRTRSDLNGLRSRTDLASLQFLFDALQRVRNSLPGQVALIGFAGAPFTLANYLIEGQASRLNLETKRLLFTDPPLLKDLLERLTDLTIRYLEAQVRQGGAEALQLFESSAGILAPHDFEQFALPYAEKVLAALRPLGVPLIYFPLGAGESLAQVAKTSAGVIGIDWHTPLGDAQRRIGPDKAIQGNLDPTVLLGSQEAIRDHVGHILRQVDPRRGFIFNLGHGVLPQTPPENAEFLVRTVRELSTALFPCAAVSSNPPDQGKQ